MHNKPIFFPAIQGLRGVLSLWVFSLHLILFMSLSLKLNAQQFFGIFTTKIFWSGFLAVDVFFILSGFFISHVFISRYIKPSYAQVIRFYWVRIARLYPVHILILSIYGIIVWGTAIPLSHNCFPYDPASTCDAFSLGAFLKNVLLIQAWDWFPQSSWNVNSWSISSEWALYLLTPLFAYLLLRVKNGLMALVLAIVIPMLMVFILQSADRAQHFHTLLLMMLQKTGNTVGYDLLSTTGPLALEFGLIRAIAGFLSGCLIYKFYQSPYYTRIRWDIAGVLSLVGIIAVVQFLPIYYCYVFFVFFILSLTRPHALSIILGRRIMQGLGNISYSLYMTHGLLLKLFAVALVGYLGPEFILTMNTIQQIILISGITATTLFTSWVVFNYIEEPARKRLGSFNLVRNTSYEPNSIELKVAS